MHDYRPMAPMQHGHAHRRSMPKKEIVVEPRIAMCGTVQTVSSFWFVPDLLRCDVLLVGAHQFWTRMSSPTPKCECPSQCP